MPRLSLLAVATLALTASAASAATITLSFDGLSGGAFTTTSPYTQNGFTVKPGNSTSFDVATSLFTGEPAPSIYTTDTGSSTVTITDGGASFELVSFELSNAKNDLFGSNISFTYAASGSGGGSFSTSGSASSLSQSDTDTVSNPYATTAVTSVTITLDGAKYADLDNIKVVPVASSVTPEPSSLVLLGSGILGLAGLLRRRIRL